MTGSDDSMPPSPTDITMTTKGRLMVFLLHMRQFQNDIKEKALDETRSPKARAAYLDVEGRLARKLGELDYLINLKWL